MHNKTLFKALIVTGISCIISFTTFAEVVVVIHPSNDASLDKKTVQRIYLGKTNKFPGGKEAIPINQAPGGNTRTSFDSDTLGRSTSQVSAYWSKLVFTGKGIPPKEVDADASVIAIVKDNPNAIGYVDSSAVTGDVKTVPLN